MSGPEAGAQAASAAGDGASGPEATAWLGWFGKREERSGPQGSVTAVAPAAGDEAPWLAADTVVFLRMSDGAPGPEAGDEACWPAADTVVFPRMSDSAPGPEAGAQAASPALDGVSTATEF